MFKNKKIELHSSEEDVAINAGIAADPDTFELSEEQVKSMKRYRGRPPVIDKKIALTVRYDADVINKFKASGSRWQTRMNDALRDWLKHNPL